MNNQSEDRVLGYVGTYPVGNYNAQTEYEYLNVVTHKGSSYVCIKEEGCIAVEPPNEEYWQLFAGKGDIGEKGDKGDTGPIGPKPVNGVDYNTNAEREEFKNAVVADSKTDLEKYITEKEIHLDNYTKEEETKLDTYVTDTVKPTIDTYVTDTTKKDIDKYEKEKEKVLDTYTDTKKAELETAKNTAIVEYDAHAESVLTETEDLFNALNTEKASGTELYIEDAKPCRIMNTEIGGMYKQETTAGANLLDTSDMLFNNGTLEQNGLTAKINTDGSIVINGTATANTYFRKSIKNILEDGNYYFYNFNNVTQSNSTYYMLIQGNKSTGYGSTDYYNARGYQTDNFIKDIITYDRTFDCMFLFINGFVANNLILYPEISKTKQTVFEPYTGGNPSPNPDYPQAIEQAESVKLMCDSSNLFNITNYNNLNLIRNGNATITKTENNFSFLTTADNYCGIYVTIAKLKEYIDSSNNNTTYNISFDVSATKNTNFWYGTSSVKTTTINTNKTRLSVTGMLTKPLTLYSRSQEAGTTITISNIKVTKTEDVEYTPYQNQAINIDLKGNKLCAVSDTIKDKLLIDRSGNVALQKNVGEVIFNGNEHWELAEKGFYNSSYFIGKKDKKNFEACCNYFLVDRLGKTWTGFNHCGFNNSGYFGIQEEHKLATTPEGFNEWLTTHNLEVYYALATPEIIDLGQLTELSKTFDGINNIWAETNLGNTEIEIEYVQDIKKLLEQQNARLDNIEALLSTTETSALLLDNMQTDLESEVE